MTVLALHRCKALSLIIFNSTQSLSVYQYTARILFSRKYVLFNYGVLLITSVVPTVFQLYEWYDALNEHHVTDESDS